METNLSLRDYRQNQVMKKVTSWAAIIAVPTLITGCYGMNVPYPGFASHSGFVVSAVTILVMSAGLFFVFRRKGWLWVLLLLLLTGRFRLPRPQALLDWSASCLLRHAVWRRTKNMRFVRCGIGGG